MVTTPGVVIEDIELRGAGVDIEVYASNVTIRRVRLLGGLICNQRSDACERGLGVGSNMTIEDTEFLPPPGQTNGTDETPRVGCGSYTLRRIKIIRAAEGPRVGCNGDARIYDSFIGVVCPNSTYHSDGIQGYGGGVLTVSNVTIDYRGGCGTSPFFYPNQGNKRADVNRLLLVGSARATCFRLGVSGSVTDLRIENNSWAYGPISNDCPKISPWQATIIQAGVPTGENGYQATPTVRSQPCNTVGGGQ